MRAMCECNSACTLRVEMSESDRKLCYLGEKSRVVISDYCTHGPEPGEIVVKKGKGYMIYERG